MSKVNNIVDKTKVAGVSIKVQSKQRTAHEILNQISGLIEERGKSYDKGEERSFTKVAHAYNAIKGNSLDGSDIALMLVILKLVRQETSDTVHTDSIDDLVAYSALYGEELEKSK